MGGELALDAAWLFAALLIVLILAAGGIAARRFLLERGGGTVECGLRKGNGSWRLGVASYQREELCWFGVFGLWLRPDEVFPRRDLTVISRRPPTQAELATLGPGMIVVECRLGLDGGQLGSPAADGTPGPAVSPVPAVSSVPAGPPRAGSAPGARGASRAAGISAPGSQGASRPAAGATSSRTGSAGPAAGSAGPGAGSADPAAGSAGPGSGSASLGETVELALGEAALTGLLAWLEAAPPGSHLGVAL
ncbi:MAG: DUF2550 family protein [Actinobacteria bacterium]|nr:DUF2550 family protein [Actinomycetota bacterium]